MQASSKYTIAIHICVFMYYTKGRLVSSQKIAESVDTNPVVIRRLIAELRKSNIIGSIPGAKGGFYLNRPAADITLWDIYLSVRDDQFFQKPKVNPLCPVSSNLAVLVDESFSKAEISMKKELDNVTVEMLTKKLMNVIENPEEFAC